MTRDTTGIDTIHPLHSSYYYKYIQYYAESTGGCIHIRQGYDSASDDASAEVLLHHS